jgi:hypothetical protein
MANGVTEVGYDEAIRLLRERAEIAEPDELPVLDRFARDRARQWVSRERSAEHRRPRQREALCEGPAWQME